MEEMLYRVYRDSMRKPFMHGPPHPSSPSFDRNQCTICETFVEAGGDEDQNHLKKDPCLSETCANFREREYMRPLCCAIVYYTELSITAVDVVLAIQEY